MSTNKETMTEQINQNSSTNNELTTRGVEDIITQRGLSERLNSGDPLRVKYGIDPTMRSAHIGHAVPIRKLRQFQELGHTAVFIIGDYTARIGDPSGRSVTRKALSEDEVSRNAKEYFDQAYKILNKDKTEIHLQSEWYGKMDLEDLIRLMSRVTYAQLMSHETFRQRSQKGEILGFHEMLYPLLQAYDSVAVKADVELGGADQRFNFVLTRDLQQSFGQKPEEVILSKYLPGTDGQEKMSKSQGNTIDLLDSADDMYFKAMSIPDDVMPIFLELATNIPLEKISELIEQLKKGTIHPMELKKLLARNICTLYHSEDETREAEEKFKSQIQQKIVPANVPSIEVTDNNSSFVNLLVKLNLASSKSEAKRLIEQGGVSLDGKKITDPLLNIEIRNSMIVKVGNRRFVKINH